MSKKTKVIESNVQPNPKEAEIWAKVNEDGSREIKQYNSSTGKFECCGGSGSGSSSGESIVKYYEVNASANSNIALREIFPFQKGTDPNGNLAIGGFLGVNNAVAVAFMPVYFNLNGELKKFMTPEDVNEAGIMDIPEGFIIKEISQDEFYNLEA